jgi:hypothetical protein
MTMPASGRLPSVSRPLFSAVRQAGGAAFWAGDGWAAAAGSLAEGGRHDDAAVVNTWNQA